MWAKSLVFSNHPRHFFCSFLRSSHRNSYQAMHIINYSTLYKDLVVENPDAAAQEQFRAQLMPPEQLLTGDVLQTTDYRGVGSYFVVWLCAGSFDNDIALSREFLTVDSGPRKSSSEEVVDFNRIDPATLQLWTSGAFKRIPFAERYAAYKTVLGDACFEEKLLISFEMRLADLRLLNDGDESSSASSDFDWDALKPYEIDDGEGYTREMYRFFEKVAPSEYPLQKSRAQLLASTRRADMHCILFSHTDEMGYSAPSAFSMARLNYFPTEGQDRDVDLVLLSEPPLNTRTQLGPILLRLQSLLPRRDDPDRANKVADLALLDFGGEDAIRWHVAEEEKEEDGDLMYANRSVLTTRDIFRKHASLMRSHLLSLINTSGVTIDSEHDLDALFARYFGTASS